MLRRLVRLGFELGDHTHDHVPLNTLGAGDAQREIVQGAQVITSAVPGYEIRTLALPLGALPKPASLALHGSWGGHSYRFDAVFLAGAEPAPSPYSKRFDPGAVPRIRSSHLPWTGKADYTAQFWLRRLEAHPELRYVSDGDPERISFPSGAADDLRTRFRRLARAY
jgi:peptidoglycan/xylan/chitin deacetylase (PgdA/CDA1 family)